MNRRGFLQGILAAGVAPYVVTASGVLMPVKKIATPFDWQAIKAEILSHAIPEDVLNIPHQLITKRGDTVIYRRWLPYGVGGLTCVDERMSIQQYHRLVSER